MSQDQRSRDLSFMREALRIGREAGARGNLPIAALVVLDGQIVAQAENEVLVPAFHPGRHAETRVLEKLGGVILLERSRQLVLYTNIEPCVMCMGAIILHRIGRVVFGARDPNRGATFILDNLSAIYRPEQLPTVSGPILEQECSPMFAEADARYRTFRDGKRTT